MVEENQKQDEGGLPYGRYLIRKRVARGGMGEVFLADQLGPTGQPIRPVALKRMLPRIARKPHAAKMFLEEMATAAQLNHPNIATTYDFGEVDGTYFFAMEYLQGLSLSQLLKSLGALPVPHTLHICLKVLDALNHAHQRKTISGKIAPVVHRDVSPHNVMISTDGTVKLLDFGISRAETEVMGGRLEGKIAYAAPEQLQGGLVDRRSDLWAVGVMMYELLCGFRPYEMASIDEIIIVARQENFLRVENLRPEAQPLSEIITQSLRFEKDQRWNDAESTINALQNAASAFPTVGPAEIAALVAAAGGPTTSVLGVEQITSFGHSGNNVNATATATLAREFAGPAEITPEREQGGVKPAEIREDLSSPKTAKNKPLWMVAILSVLGFLGVVLVTASPVPEPRTSPIAVDVPTLKPPRVQSPKKEVVQETDSKPKQDSMVEKTPKETETTAPKADTVQKAKVSREKRTKPSSPKKKATRKSVSQKKRGPSAVAKEKIQPSKKITPPRETTRKQAAPAKATTKIQDAKPLGPSHVSVTSTPWANIEIDGRAYGVTPKLKIKLKPGKHRLRLTPGDGQRRTAKVFELTVKSDQHIRIIADFPKNVFRTLGQ